MDDPKVDRQHGVQDVSLLQILIVILRHRRRTGLLSFVLAMALGLLALSQEREYTSTASFVPETARESAQVMQMAQRFGIGSVGSQGGESPAFYQNLVESREILDRVIDSTFAVEDADGEGARKEGTWIDLFDLEADREEALLEGAIEHLRGRIDVSTDEATRVIHVSVTTPWATLSRDVASLLVELVNEFNVERRRSQASEERAFVLDRLEQARRELREAEDTLEAFYEQNRRFEQSPSLLFEAERLERVVAHRQGVTTSLRQSYEEARIEEVRTTPVITTVGEAHAPAVPDPRGVILRAIIGALIGLVVGSMWAFGKEFLYRATAGEDDDAREFARLRSELGAEVRNPFRLLLPPGRDGRAKVNGEGSAERELEPRRGNSEGAGRQAERGR